MGIWKRLFLPEEVPGKSGIAHPFDEKDDLFGYTGRAKGADEQMQDSRHRKARGDGNPRVYGPAHPVRSADDDIAVVYGPAAWMSARRNMQPEDGGQMEAPEEGRPEIGVEDAPPTSGD